MWTPLNPGAVDVQAAGTRIAFRDGAGNIVAKDGLNGSWYTIPAPVDQYGVTSSLLIVRASGTLYVKASLADGWTTIPTSNVVDVKAASPRLAYLDAGGTLWVRDGVTGTSLAETRGVTQYAATPNYLLVRQGTTVYGKANLSDQWGVPLTTSAVDLQAAGTRIAIRDGAGNVAIKDGLNGGWVTETAPIDQYVITPSLVLIRFGGDLWGEVNAADPLVYLTRNVADVIAAGNQMAIKDTSGNISVKDGLNGAWFFESGPVNQYLVTGAGQ